MKEKYEVSSAMRRDMNEVTLDEINKEDHHNSTLHT